MVWATKQSFPPLADPTYHFPLLFKCAFVDNNFTIKNKNVNDLIHVIPDRKKAVPLLSRNGFGWGRQ